MVGHSYKRTYRFAIRYSSVQQFDFALCDAFDSLAEEQIFSAIGEVHSPIRIVTFRLSLPEAQCKQAIERLRQTQPLGRKIDLLLQHLAEDIGLNVLGIWPPMNMAV